MYSDVDALAHLTKKITSFPTTLFVLGSGWNSMLQELTIEKQISYKELFGVGATVPGHEGRLVIGKLRGTRIACMSGRFHMYEGYSAYEATTPIRVFAKAGMNKMVITAACGALNEKYRVGDFVILTDMLTLLLALDNPVKGPHFTDVSEVFDTAMREQARKMCVEKNIPFHEGIYAYYHGPNYETPADKVALKVLGADVCGMSTVPETLVARSLGVKTLGLSFVTNLAFVKHNHKEVIAEANKASKQMKALLSSLASRFG